MATATVAAILLAALGAVVAMMVVTIRSFHRQIAGLQAQLKEAHAFLVSAAMATETYTRNRIAAEAAKRGGEPVPPPMEPSLDEQEQEQRAAPGLRMYSGGGVERVPGKRPVEGKAV